MEALRTTWSRVLGVTKRKTVEVSLVVLSSDTKLTNLLFIWTIRGYSRSPELLGHCGALARRFKKAIQLPRTHLKGQGT